MVPAKSVQGKEAAMRFASIVAMLVIAGAARAQGSASGVERLFGRTGAPRELKFVPVDTSRALAPSASFGNVMRAPASQVIKPLNLTNIFPKITMPSWPPKTAQTSVLPQAQNIYQPAPPKGVNLFNFSPK
jgi:hypothetical protein